MAKHGEPPLVLFSCEVLKINRRGEAVPRTLLVCANSIFLLDADARRGARRKIPLRSLASLRMSEMSDNFLAMVCPAEYDLLVVCGRKTELVVVLREAHRCAMVELGMGGGDREGRDGLSVDAAGRADVGLRVELSNRFTYKAGANVAKAVTFTRAGDGEVDTEVADIVVSSPG
jgi:hypothetical protein